MNILTQSVEELEGIGPVTKASLADADIHFVVDLLLHRAERIHEFVANNNSLEQVLGWQSMALLLQADDLNPQWAEALLDGRIDSAEEFLSKSWLTLKSTFSEAVEERRIPDGPGDDELHEIAKQIARIHYRGTAQGVVLNEGNEPIEGAEVSFGFFKAITNAKGIWRICGLDSSLTQSILIKKEGYQDHFESAYTVYNDNYPMELGSVVLRLGESQPELVDEYLGGEIDFSQFYVADVELMPEEDLREQDYLLVQSFYKSEEAVKMTSIFRAVSQQTLFIRTYKVSLSRFENAPKLNEYYKYSDSVFRKSHGMGARLIDRIRITQGRRLQIIAELQNLEHISDNNDQANALSLEMMNLLSR